MQTKNNLNRNFLDKANDFANEHYNSSWSEVREASEESYLYGVAEFRETLLHALTTFHISTTSECFQNGEDVFVKRHEIINDVMNLVRNIK